MICKNQRHFNSAATLSKYNNLQHDQLFLTLLINLVSAAWSSCLLLVRRLTLRLKGKKKPRRASATHSTVRESIWRYYLCIKQKKRVRFTRYLQFITLLNIKFAGVFLTVNYHSAVSGVRKEKLN